MVSLEKAAFRSSRHNSKNKRLTGSKRLSKFKILKRNPARDRPLTSPVNVPSVHRADEILAHLRRRLAPILRHFSAAIIPEMRPPKRFHTRRILLVVLDRNHRVAIAQSRHALDSKNFMRR